MKTNLCLKLKRIFNKSINKLQNPHNIKENLKNDLAHYEPILNIKLYKMHGFITVSQYFSHNRIVDAHGKRAYQNENLVIHLSKTTPENRDQNENAPESSESYSTCTSTSFTSNSQTQACSHSVHYIHFILPSYLFHYSVNLASVHQWPSQKTEHRLLESPRIYRVESGSKQKHNIR